MNATRFALKPIPQPSYAFCNVPAATKDLQGSTVQCLTDREAWQACMGEMLLVCKEAIRRRIHSQQPAQGETVQDEGGEEDDRKPAAASSTLTAHHSHHHAHHHSHHHNTHHQSNHHHNTPHGSKPLSLEYIADRLDVDDPMWGYVIRHEGMLQGFITVTTFTNYQRTFRWDSCHARSFTPEEDDDNNDGDNHHDNNNNNNHNDPYDMANRKVDLNGSLAREMNVTVRAGDIWNEGIVWPRIAEIGLLGGLSCGRTLVKLVLEQLQYMKRSSRANYDYVVLQATDNSIPFYESLGFIRIGAIMQQENISDNNNEFQDDHNSSNSNSNSSSSSDTEEEVIAEPLASSDDSQQQGSLSNNDHPHHQQATALATPCARVSSQTLQYTIKKTGETPTTIAKHFNVSAYDIVFLNQYLYPELTPYSKMRIGTILFIPNETIALPPPPPPTTATQSLDDQKQQQQQPVSWYIAKENETPRSIARKFGLDCMELVNANKIRLQGLLSSSRLKDGTRVKISHFDSPIDVYKPYAHWTFPDDKFEEGEPSYMMALKLNRCNNNNKKNNNNNKDHQQQQYRPFANSLAVPVEEYDPNNIKKQQDNDNDNVLLQSTNNDSAAAAAAAATAAGPPRPGRASRRRWQSHQDADTNSSSTSNNSNSTTTTLTTATNPSDTTAHDDKDDDDDDEYNAIIKIKPKLPQKPAFVEPYRLFVADYKRKHVTALYKKHVGEISRITGDAWRQLSTRQKQKYEQRIAAFKHEYETAMHIYHQQMTNIRNAKKQRRLKKLGLLQAAATATASTATAAPQAPLPVVVHEQQQQQPSINLFNKVVKIKPCSGNMTEAGVLPYVYWYVLTYIPDLQWCHLAPMYQVGRVFGDDKPNSKGRPIWKLVDENRGEEVDISSSLVIPVKAKSMKRTLDADKEEWDIIGTPLPLTAPAPSRSKSFGGGLGFNVSHQSVSRRGSFGDNSTYDGSSSVATSTVGTATTTSTNRKRKRSSLGSEMSAAASSSIQQLPSFAMAVMPQTCKRVKVWIKLGLGQRGRPKGSKNKKPSRPVPNHVVTTGQKKPPPSSYASSNTRNNNNTINNNKANNDNNNGGGRSTRNNNNKADNDNNNGGGRSIHHSTRSNSRVEVVMPMEAMASLEHASTPVKPQRQQQQTSKSKKQPTPAKSSRRSPSTSQKNHSAVVPASQKTRNSKKSVTEDETGGALAAVDRLDHGDDAKTASVLPQPPKFPVGSVVVVQARTLLGRYKPGGVARVTRVQPGDSNLYDVMFVLGGRVKDVEEVFLSWNINSNNNSTRPLPKREAAVDDELSVPVENQPDTQITMRPVEDQPSSSSSLPLGNPPVFPVAALVTVQARNGARFNKPGGVARVTRVQQSEPILYDVKYVLGGSEMNVEESFLSWHDDDAVRPTVPSSSELVSCMKVSTRTTRMTEKQQDLQKISSQPSTEPANAGKTTSSLVKHPRSTAAAHSDDDAIASGGENNSQSDRTSSRQLRTKRLTTLALLDDGTRGRETPRSKSMRTRSTTSCIESSSSSSILKEVATVQRSNKRRRRADGTFMPSPPSRRRRRVRDPLELLMP